MLDPKIRTVVLISGIQGGKSTFGAFATRKALREYKGQDNAFIVGAPTFPIMEQSTLPSFKKLHSDLFGKYSMQRRVFTLMDGRNVWFRTAKDPDSVEGIPDCVFAWIDEAGKVSREFFVNVQARLARRQGKLVLTTTWYHLNWLYKEIWKPWERGLLPDTHIVHYKSTENPSFPKEELEAQRLKLSKAEFQRKYEGEPGQAEGVVFDGWKDRLIIDPIKFGPAAQYYGGVDWGSDHPFSCTVGAYPGDNKSYLVSAYRQRRLTATQMIDEIVRRQNVFHVKRWFCGADRPEMISELQTRGINACKYFEDDENYKYVNTGNGYLNSLMKEGRYLVFKTLKQLEDLDDEFSTYEWRKLADGSPIEKEKPVNINDDLISAERYRIIGTKSILEQKTPYSGFKDVTIARQQIDPLYWEERQEKSYDEI